jgi:hypothetical protein
VLFKAKLNYETTPKKPTHSTKPEQKNKNPKTIATKQKNSYN